ncbi:hypothetical protein FD755_019139 [Muntiacus reevesi]|uniref:Uncharacterized protein n=1 Tax=Muntiacus reevesi TaxID=9886 RepID=A0A5N3X657_MUNRE|nr:hypothetical protein FD755_019139 [Muntiacus reevesi]
MIRGQFVRLNAKWIQGLKENTEQRAKETEGRVGKASSGSLRRCKSVSSLDLYSASSLASSCPPSSVPSTPRMRRRRPARNIGRLGTMPLKSGFLTLRSLKTGRRPKAFCDRMPALREEVENDKNTIECETSSPASPESLRLEQLHSGALHAASPEDVRDARNSMDSQDGPGGNPSSSSSQDSTHKAPKKKGIRGRPGHAGKEALGPGRIFTARATWKAPMNTDN